MEFALYVLLFVAGLFVGRFLPSYFKEKGKNLATKEDIAAITDKVEEIRAAYARRLQEESHGHAVRVAINEEQVRHDRELFRRYDRILSEEAMRNELDAHLFNHHTSLNFTGALEDFTFLSARAEGRFLTPEVQSALESATRSLQSLREFVFQHFFTPHAGPRQAFDGSTYIALYPEARQEFNNDLATRYARHAGQLLALIEETASAFSGFRTAVKSHLQQ